MKTLIYMIVLFLLGANLYANDHEKFIVDIDKDKVTITHKNLYANCCSYFETEIQFDAENNKIIIIERDTSVDKCYCMCYFDLETKISQLKAGKYEVEIYIEELKKYMYPKDKKYLVWSGEFEITVSLTMPPISYFFNQSDCIGMTSVETNKQKNQYVAISPNPVRGELNISFISQQSDFNLILYIFDSTGKVVFSEEIQRIIAGENNYSISLESLPQGSYFGYIEGKMQLMEFEFNLIK